jgi:hypothetical protein
MPYGPIFFGTLTVDKPVSLIYIPCGGDGTFFRSTTFTLFKCAAYLTFRDLMTERKMQILASEEKYVPPTFC